MRQRKPRPTGELQVTRKSPDHSGAGGHGGEGSWAVSYADLLMVLLSFFVMFFTFKEQNPETVEAEIIKVARTMRGTPVPQRTPQLDLEDIETQEVEDDQAGVPVAKGQEVKGSATPDPTKSSVGITNGTAPATEEDPRLLEISKALQIDGVRVTNDKTQLIVTMDNSAFEPASYLLSISLQQRINDVLRQLRPYFGAIQLTVVGHADRAALRSKSDLMQDNFDLSSIRALRVLKYVVGRGFPENRASARASSFFDRDARSISMVIQSAPKNVKGGT